jgi:hypothetical protein
VPGTSYTPAPLIQYIRVFDSVSFIGNIGAAVFLPADWATGLAADHQQPKTSNPQAA